MLDLSNQALFTICATHLKIDEKHGHRHEGEEEVGEKIWKVRLNVGWWWW
jgi:hypothetical protein